MEQMEQLLPGTPRAICAIRTNPIFLEEEVGSLGADSYIHTVYVPVSPEDPYLL